MTRRYMDCDWDIAWHSQGFGEEGPFIRIIPWPGPSIIASTWGNALTAFRNETSEVRRRHAIATQVWSIIDRYPTITVAMANEALQDLDLELVRSARYVHNAEDDPGDIERLLNPHAGLDD